MVFPLHPSNPTTFSFSAQKLDSDNVVESAPESFRSLLTVLGIESTIESLVQSVCFWSAEPDQILKTLSFSSSFYYSVKLLYCQETYRHISSCTRARCVLNSIRKARKINYLNTKLSVKICFSHSRGLCVGTVAQCSEGWTCHDLSEHQLMFNVRPFEV